MAGKNTPERILDAAERLFARQGYHNTSLREITTAATANLAGVNYHFGSKENLLSSVLNRYLGPLNTKRLEMLENARKMAQSQNRPPRVEELMRVFFEPIFDMLESDEGGIDILLIISQIHIDPDDTIRKLFLERVQPLFREFIDALGEALPNRSKESIVQRFIFSIGAMVHAVTNHGAADDLSEMLGEPLAKTDIRTLAVELIGFATRGMEGE